MNRAESHLSLHRHRLFQYQLWVIAIVFFGIGDVVTTGFGLRLNGISEASPVVAPLIYRYGLVAMVGLKIVVLGGCFVLWKLVPNPHRTGAPIALAIVGVLVTSWNLHLVTLALLL